MKCYEIEFLNNTYLIVANSKKEAAEILDEQCNLPDYSDYELIYIRLKKLKGSRCVKLNT